MNVHPSERMRGTSLMPLLEIREMSKTFPGTRALDHVDLDIAAGEVHALVGQNGSGKSTLIKVLAGFHEPDPGTLVRVDGEEVELADPAASRAAGFRFVHQDLALVDDLSVVENLALGRGFQTGAMGRIRWRDERRAAQEMLDSLGFDFDVRKPLGTLAAAERTGVAIARAMWNWEDGARILVLDEPTATLPMAEVETLFRTVRRVRERGLGVIYVSHRLDEVFSIGDRISILRDGRKVGTYKTADLDEDKLIALMVGEAVTRVAGAKAAPGGATVLAVEGLCGTVLCDLSFEAKAGQVLGFAGLTGSGREELLPLIFGAGERLGTVAVDGRKVKAARPESAIAAGIALIPSDRLHQGGVFDMSVTQNLTLTDPGRLTGPAKEIRRGRERSEVRDWIGRLDVRPSNPDLPLAALSGGNQQKIVIAKWLRMSPRVLLLDEPTQGVDVGAKAMIHALVREAAAAGAAVVVASGDDEEICDICDQVYVLRDGAIVGELTQEQMSIDEVGRMQLVGRGNGHAPVA
ncbi:MAG: sugar ABC transporter ATP-binding protein [Actinobacteria bacterium]|nr:sugar ABC transporter ATP-binding protein [Actinomycetota bacterium]